MSTGLKEDPQAEPPILSSSGTSSSTSSTATATATSLMPSSVSAANLTSSSGSLSTPVSQQQQQKSSPSAPCTSIPPPPVSHSSSSNDVISSSSAFPSSSSSSSSKNFNSNLPLSPPAMTSPCFVHSYLDQAVDLTRRQQKRSNSHVKRSNLNNKHQSQIDDLDTPHPLNHQSETNTAYFNTNHDSHSGRSPMDPYHSNPPKSNRTANPSSSRANPSFSKTKEDQVSATSADTAARDASSRSKSWSRGIRGAADSGSEEERRRSKRRDSTDDSTSDNDAPQGSDQSGNSSGSDTYSRGSSFTLSSQEEDEDEDRVRSLTRQLAETAVGVREMSKQLGRARVKSNIHSVLIITKARDNHLIKLTRELALWLMLTPRNGKDTGLVVYVDSQLKSSKRFDSEGIKRDYPQLFNTFNENGNGGSFFSNPSNNGNSQRRKRSFSGDSQTSEREGSGLSSSVASSINNDRHSRNGNGNGEDQLRYWTSDMCSRSPHLFDFVVTLGGDGTVLFCSWLFQRIVPPVMPFALGSLGFLTNFDFAHYKSVMQSALDDGIRVNLRMRFTATVYRATLPPSSNSRDDRVRKRAIKSGRTGEIIMKSIRESGWDRIESPDKASCLDLKNEKLHENEDLSRFQNGEREGQSQSKPNVTGEVIDPSDSNPKGHFGKKGKGKDKKDKEVMCFYTRPVETFEVLNDLVVDRGPSPYVSLLEVFGDEHHMTTAQADGLCISTPTGSTAYSLSAGGSLVHPEIPAILITPICPHTLSFRPMLLPDSIELRIAVPYNSRSTAWASFDGRGRVELRQGDHIKVTASRYPFPTVCSENQSTDWFKSISRTLKWNERQRQKSFVVVEGDDDGDGAQKKERRKRSKGKEVDRPTSEATRKEEGKESTASASKEKELAGKSGDGRDQDQEARIPANDKKSATTEDDNDDDEDDADEEEEDEEEEPEEEEAETFDIDDTSTNVTRAGSPTHTSKSHHHHHHHHHSHHHRRESSSRSTSSLSLPNGLSTSFAGSIGRSASSSQNPSRRESHEALFRLMALTPASNPNTSKNSESIPNSHGAPQSRQSPSPPSHTSDPVPPSMPSSNNTANPSSHVRPPPSPISNHSVDSHSSTASYDQSTLNSPDRFGIAGPPEPPRAISERHLAHADFRLDAIQNEMARGSNSTQIDVSESSSSNPIPDTTTIRNVDAPRAGFSAPSRSPISASSILKGVNSSGIGNGISLRDSMNSDRRGSTSSQGRKKSSSNSRPEGSTGASDVEVGSSSSSGGTALVVYGEDESETESE